MLTRIAGNAFWMARYLERAENNARLIRMALAHDAWPEAADDPRGLWSTALEVGGTLDDYEARIGTLASEPVIRFMIIDRENPSGIVSCLRTVRDNARTARNLLNESSWEIVNTTWQQAQQLDQAAVEDPWTSTGWAIERCRLAWGGFDDLWRDSFPHVLDLGDAVERADFTARFLAEMLPTLLADGSDPPPIDHPLARRWKSLLAGLGMTETWRRAQRGPLEPVALLQLILLHPTSPHSLLSNVQRMAKAIEGLAGTGRGGRTLAVARQFEETVLSADLARLVEGEGMPGFIAKLTATTNLLGAEAASEHFT